MQVVYGNAARRLTLVLAVATMLAGLGVAPSSATEAANGPVTATAGDWKYVQAFVGVPDEVKRTGCQTGFYNSGDCSLIVYGFSGESTIVDIWDTDAKAVKVFTDTFTPTDDRYVVDAGDLAAGNYIEVTGASESIQYTVGTITADIDWENDTVSGTITPSGRADVWVITKERFASGSSDGFDICGRVVLPDAQGDWTADFSTPADSNNAEECQQTGAATTYDFGPGDLVIAFDAFSGDPMHCDANCITNTLARVRDFADDDGSIFELDITWLADQGITRGCNPPTNDLFCPTSYVTRDQMAAFLVRALGLTDDGGGNSFTDDDGSIFETDIAKLAAAGITRGCNPPTNDLFCPTSYVTRDQMAAFLRRALS